MESGLIGASLSQDLYKKRIALPNRGKRSSVRVVLAFQSGYRTIFIYGFEKNERDNMRKNDEAQLKKLFQVYLGFSDEQIKKAIRIGQLLEVA